MSSQYCRPSSKFKRDLRGAELFALFCLSRPFSFSFLFVPFATPPMTSTSSTPFNSLPRSEGRRCRRVLAAPLLEYCADCFVDEDDERENFLTSRWMVDSLRSIAGKREKGERRGLRVQSEESDQLGPGLRIGVHEKGRLCRPFGL